MLHCPASGVRKLVAASAGRLAPGKLAKHGPLVPRLQQAKRDGIIAKEEREPGLLVTTRARVCTPWLAPLIRNPP